MLVAFLLQALSPEASSLECDLAAEADRVAERRGRESEAVSLALAKAKEAFAKCVARNRLNQNAISICDKQFAAYRQKLIAMEIAAKGNSYSRTDVEFYLSLAKAEAETFLREAY